ncbi:uncharacterized protein LOC143018049 isoform X2 [Oratosquilla oratoria]|uniref:uncharacterized protein LOC143018049 isoform X2 n=1 Tax=Oratosquilla oratoria TaxID=337810 RepID=UPI003F7775AF
MVNESGTCGDEMEVGKDEEPSLEDYRRIGDQLAKPFTDLGVVYISNHGIPEEEIGKAIRTALHFFSLPKSTKMKYLRLPGSKCGYVEVGKEKVDLKGLLTEMYEAFNCTTRGDGAWPDDELPHLRKNMNSFFDICRQLSIRIMRCMSATLVPLKEEVTRMGAHTDYHTFTFLFLDDVRGLQIKDRQGEWLDVVSIPGAILINIADLMKCWTGDTWRAVPHRVVLPNDEVRQQRRLSMAFFAKPDNNIILESVCGTNRYAVNVTEHVKRKVAELKKSD